MGEDGEKAGGWEWVWGDRAEVYTSRKWGSVADNALKSSPQRCVRLGGSLGGEEEEERAAYHICQVHHGLGKVAGEDH